jgi:Na+(H+)/acetate symporter ActP
MCESLTFLRVCIGFVQALGTEVRTFTGGEISATTAVLVAAAVLLVCDLLGGMRAVAYTGAVVRCFLFCISGGGLFPFCISSSHLFQLVWLVWYVWLACWQPMIMLMTSKGM